MLYSTTQGSDGALEYMGVQCVVLYCSLVYVYVVCSAVVLYKKVRRCVASCFIALHAKLR